MLITSATPLRVSFLGGGTDYLSYFRNFDGYVFGTTINMYVYISAIKNSSLSGHKYKISYRELDECNELSEIRHPVVREVLKSINWQGPGLHISTLSDVPAGTGLGSSSSFTVGMFNLVAQLSGGTITAEELAQSAINIERVVLGEFGGIQDQYHASYGGLAGYEIQHKQVTVNRVMDPSKIDYLSDCLFLVPYGKPRSSSTSASKYSSLDASKKKSLDKTRELAFDAHKYFLSSSNPDDATNYLTDFMEEAWAKKVEILENYIDRNLLELVDFGKSVGAKTGKLCGAGQTGYILFIVPPEGHRKFENSFSNSGLTKIAIEKGGSRILVNNE
jgi:D-glycero-alpha-D-manno-heptose-7-phosphate kinase